jgi:hypothetical protein
MKAVEAVLGVGGVLVVAVGSSFPKTSRSPIIILRKGTLGTVAFCRLVRAELGFGGIRGSVSVLSLYCEDVLDLLRGQGVVTRR